MSTRRQNPSSSASGNGAGASSENASKKRALNGIKNSFENKHTGKNVSILKSIFK